MFSEAKSYKPIITLLSQNTQDAMVLKPSWTKPFFGQVYYVMFTGM